MKRTGICLLTVFFIIMAGCFENKTADDGVRENSQQAPSVTTPSVTSVPLTTVPSTTPAPTPALTSKPENPKEISSFTTIIYDKEENRVNNIKIAAEELDGTVIEPGEVFSFNETVGKRSKEKGYEEASIFVDGEKSKGVGGGVCQVSTTLYNAALKADLEIIERHRHSRKVSYVEEGKDAAVVYNSKDLRFKNTRDYPIEIRISVTEDEIRVTLNKKSE